MNSFDPRRLPRRSVAAFVAVASAISGFEARATAQATFADPNPDPASAIGTSALLTSSHAIAGAEAKRSLDASQLPIALGALIAWPRGVSGTPDQSSVIVLPSDGQRAERFGAALAQSNSVIAVGSPGYNALLNVLSRGRVRLLDESFATIATIDPSIDILGLEFGAAVAIDGATLVVGAPGNRAAPDDTALGSVFVYEGSPLGWSQGWSQAAELSVPLAAGTRFGSAVAMTSDSVLVGAPGGGADGVPSHGRVWIYDRADLAAAPLEVVAPEAQLDDRFGIALASFGDITVIGAPGSACGVGRVFIGRVHANTFTPLATLVPPDAAPAAGWNGFGSCVAISGSRVAIATGGIADEGTFGHRVAIYRRERDVWLLEQVLSADDQSPAMGTVALDAAGAFSALPLGGASSEGAMRYDELPRLLDLDGNGSVGASDLGILLGSWGPTDGVAAADLDADGVVGPADLASLLGGWTR